MQKLLRKSVPRNWTEECQKSFEKVRELLSTAPILKQPDEIHTFVLSTDASNVT
jgi:hypothetical protein